MSHRLVLEIPEEIYKPLAETAKRAETTAEALALDWLAAISIHAARDPVEGFIGAIRGTVPDWTEQHDKYLGKTLADQLRADTGAGS